MKKTLILSSLLLLFVTYIETTISQQCDEPCTQMSTCSPPNYGKCCHKKNIARDSQYTNQSSVFKDHNINFYSNLAVDGIISTDFTSGSCTHTEYQPGAYWMINLEYTYNVSEMKLYLRSNNGARYNGLAVHVDSTECYRLNRTLPYATPPEYNPLHIHCSPPIPGNLVKVNITYDFLTLCEVQIFECEPGWYGEDCDRRCNCLDSADCDKETGWCSEGCRAGKQGDGCQCDCQDGKYGLQCRETCGHCLDGDVCNKTSGTCPQGCVQGFKPPLCQECDAFYHRSGGSCVKCGACGNNQPCDVTSGICQGDCETGYKQPFCKDECDDGAFGINCESTCGQCFDNEICNKTDGRCPHGCVENFASLMCSECVDGMYGEQCDTPCGHCLEDLPCNKTTGECATGCSSEFEPPLCHVCREYFYLSEDQCVRCGQCENNETCRADDGECEGNCAPGYKMPNCKQECEAGLYGPDCESTCGQCAGDEVCSKTSGRCPGGCVEGFTPPFCADCIPGRYGVDCQSICGQCDNATCSRDGSCPHGCITGFTDGLCQTLVQEENLKVAPIAGGIVAVIVMLIIIVVVIIIMKRRRVQKKPKPMSVSRDVNEKDTSFINISDPSPTKHVNREPKKHQKSAQKVISKDNASTDGVKGLNKSKKAKESKESPLEQKQEERVRDTPSDQELEEKPEDCSTEPPDGGNEYYSVIPAPIALSKLAQYIKDRLTGVGFDNEFKLLPYGIHDDHDEGRKPDNKKRNRFLELFPYDHSRVVLKPEVDADWDYINASYITDYRETKTFIAAQGPNLATVDDFWRMVWQENVSQIVMLTRLMELVKKKCEQYWPDDDEMKQCGNISVHHENSTVRGDYTIRTFNIKHAEHPSKTREVTQLHFTSWPDHDVPSAPALVSFWKQFRNLQQDSNTGPVVVHCSAGVGRTGTFIALDSLFDEAEREKRVNVFNCVNQMRKARMNMVQTASQYGFLHEVVLEAVESRNTLYTSTEFDMTFGTGNTFTEDQEGEIQRQFQTLRSMRRTFTEKQVSDSRLPENVSKHRDKNLVPENKSKPFLTTPVEGRNQYINAVVLPSFTHPSALIATQTPLPDTVVDFWRLVNDHDIVSIVCLEDDQDLYPNKDALVESGPFQICLDKKRKRSSFTQTQISLTNMEEPESARQITVYRPSCDNPSDLLEFVNEIELRGVLKQSKLLVQCNNGADLCGLFCSVLNIITRLRLDREVDIFLDIRELQSIRPSFIHTLDQYRFCFETVKEYQRSTSIYANV